MALYNLVSITGGFVFTLPVLNIKALRIDRVQLRLIPNIAAGAMTIHLGHILLAILLDQAMLEVIAFSFLSPLEQGFLPWMGLCS